MTKPLVSYNAGKNCKVLTRFFEEDEEESE